MVLERRALSRRLEQAIDDGVRNARRCDDGSTLRDDVSCSDGNAQKGDGQESPVGGFDRARYARTLVLEVAQQDKVEELSNSGVSFNT